MNATVVVSYNLRLLPFTTRLNKSSDVRPHSEPNKSLVDKLLASPESRM